MSAQGVNGAPSELTLLRAALEAEEPITMFDSAETAAALRTWQRWWDGRAHADVLTEAISWLGKATVDEQRNDLFLGREALSQRLHDPSLGSAPERWASLVADVERFQAHYGVVYMHHRETYHATMGELGHRMEDILDDELDSFVGSVLREATDG